MTRTMRVSTRVWEGMDNNTFIEDFTLFSEICVNLEKIQNINITTQYLQQFDSTLA